MWHPIYCIPLTRRSRHTHLVLDAPSSLRTESRGESSGGAPAATSSSSLSVCEAAGRCVAHRSVWCAAAHEINLRSVACDSDSRTQPHAGTSPCTKCPRTHSGPVRWKDCDPRPPPSASRRERARTWAAPRISSGTSPPPSARRVCAIVSASLRGEAPAANGVAFLMILLAGDHLRGVRVTRREDGSPTPRRPDGVDSLRDLDLPVEDCESRRARVDAREAAAGSRRR